MSATPTESAAPAPESAAPAPESAAPAPESVTASADPRQAALARAAAYADELLSMGVTDIRSYIRAQRLLGCITTFTNLAIQAAVQADMYGASENSFGAKMSLVGAELQVVNAFAQLTIHPLYKKVSFSIEEWIFREYGTMVQTVLPEVRDLLRSA